MKEALVLIDIQRDYFPKGAFPLSGMKKACAQAAKVLEWARNRRMKIVHVRHEEHDEESGFLLAETEGAEISEIVAPRRGETVVTKHWPNAFKETDLQEKLSRVDRLIIVGAMSNMCVDATARTAVDLGFEIIVVEDACAASSLGFKRLRLEPESVHAAFMASLALGYGAVCTVKELLKMGR